ncbi:DEAD/DEAH box helicase [uncultured Draconibacterium sp.]|uniref:DEAD/DEAH box helicase n=1 Tax=uncultured Draconibacterium sp. TaxID=1573823 RepID=UPI0025E3D2C1|nr:DEAD/DEAH box helicase [uncultured Draconibacterium sp.]
MIKSKVLKVRKNKKQLDFHNHQSESYKSLTDFYLKNKKSSGLIVIPTAGGKTHVASSWLMKNLVDNNKKVIWLGHYHYLLEEAVDAFNINCNKEHLPNRKRISVNVVSGSTRHNNVIDIDKNDDIIIGSKDCLLNNLQLFKSQYLNHHDEIFVVIDEAHRAVAPSYKKLIQFIDDNTNQLTILGLTATPVRTSSNESLLEVFHDDIIYSTDLFDLVKQGVIALPVFIPVGVDESFVQNEAKYTKVIKNYKKLPDNVKRKLAYHHHLNQLIVHTYKKSVHSKTIVFAIDQEHAVQLTNLFNAQGNNARYVISNASDNYIRTVMDDFKANKFDILVNVNILTEGVNYPDVESLFLTRPTSSKILFNQMMGRALRGVKAGGTKEANIVCFINNWEELISWSSPKSLKGAVNLTKPGINNRNNYNVFVKVKHNTQGFISSIGNNVKIKILNDKLKRKVPVGWYFINLFSCNSPSKAKRIIVYEDEISQYNELCNWLSIICDYGFSEHPMNDDFLKKVYEVLPSLKSSIIKDFTIYYLLYEEAPSFHSLNNNLSFDLLDNFKKTA